MTSRAKYIGVENLRETLEGIELETCEYLYVLVDQSAKTYVLQCDSPLFIAWNLLQEYGFELTLSDGRGAVGYAHFHRLIRLPSAVNGLGMMRSTDFPTIVLVTLDAQHS